MAASNFARASRRCLLIGAVCLRADTAHSFLSPAKPPTLRRPHATCLRAHTSLAKSKSANNATKKSDHPPLMDDLVDDLWAEKDAQSIIEREINGGMTIEDGGSSSDTTKLVLVGGTLAV
eukprot:CAMPEP_0172554248 /NCGR_PEP_ID=MMETSP1067-20121228/53808_1 /TAXON_ID=265564 ORGANISM="Thalassiosira punctigera, Strain Tpunct2005C2" /NCGR_SAMPLE_ID=MMETSP1067 /ASSEMBLY_ACC=CAM_ASM_000444 /LENGTH=119 /DNA_ID=CAMNT_0013342581 /DNA_START=112 /DNA_END=468 /DNA_ORIENTATION=+